jgi:hypothetical protein
VNRRVAVVDALIGNPQMIFFPDLGRFPVVGISPLVYIA